MKRNVIDRQLFPELDALLWDDHARFISRKRSFYIYETRFQFIDTKKITEKEKQLIEELANEFGGGFLLTK